MSVYEGRKDVSGARRGRQIYQRAPPTFEELAKRLDQLESHVLEQAADVVVRLDRRARALEADALDHVRVERTLEQPLDLSLVRLGLLELGGLLLEHVNERVPDDLALLLGVLDALEAREEEFGRVDDGQVHAEVLVQHVVHLHRLVQAEHAIVDHDGMESSQADYVRNSADARHPEGVPVANGFVHEFGSDRAINTATDGTNNPTVFPTDFTDASNFLPYKLLLRRCRVKFQTQMSTCRYIYPYHCPVAFAATDIADESGDDLLSPWGVRHLWVKLYAVEWFRVMGNGGIGRGCRVANDMEIWRGRRDLVSMRHPYLQNPTPISRRTTDEQHRETSQKKFVAPPSRRPFLRTRHRRTIDRSQTC